MSANNDTRKEEDELEKDVMKDKAGAQTIRTPVMLGAVVAEYWI